MRRPLDDIYALLHDRMDYTPFEGLSIRGWPVMTIARGEVVMRNGEVVGREARGRFLERRPGGQELERKA